MITRVREAIMPGREERGRMRKKSRDKNIRKRTWNEDEEKESVNQKREKKKI